MQFPLDAGLSCIRYFLAGRDAHLESAAMAQMTSRGRFVGSMVCQCRRETGWQVIHFENQPFIVLACGCNGSSVPVYIGEPPFTPPDEYSASGVRGGELKPCQCGATYQDRLAIGIGYPEFIPPQGSLDVERAQEVIVLARCGNCGGTFTRWLLRLAQPPTITGDEPWLRKIQGYDFSRRYR